MLSDVRLGARCTASTQYGVAAVAPALRTVHETATRLPAVTLDGATAPAGASGKHGKKRKPAAAEPQQQGAPAAAAAPDAQQHVPAGAGGLSKKELKRQRKRQQQQQQQV